MKIKTEANSLDEIIFEVLELSWKVSSHVQVQRILNVIKEIREETEIKSKP